VILRLDQFVSDAITLNWDQFKVKHNQHVIVLIPPDNTDSSTIHTAEFASGPPASRPPITEGYRVGILQKRSDGHTFDCSLTIGRAKNNDIVLRDIEVSKVHAFFEHADGWTIRDNESTNGTYLNGVRIAADAKISLKSSDTLKIGPGLSAVFFSPDDFYQFLRSPGVRGGFE